MSEFLICERVPYVRGAPESKQSDRSHLIWLKTFCPAQRDRSETTRSPLAADRCSSLGLGPLWLLPPRLQLHRCRSCRLQCLRHQDRPTRQQSLWTAFQRQLELHPRKRLWTTKLPLKPSFDTVWVSFSTTKLWRSSPRTCAQKATRMPAAFGGPSKTPPNGSRCD